MNRRDSGRPPQRSSALVELERLVRQLGQPEQGLLDAASETLHGANGPIDLTLVPKFVEEAGEVCTNAHARWRDCTAEQRALLRGCSLDLIGLTADQCLRLDRSFAEYLQSEADVKGAADNLASAIERVAALAEQARSVIQTVSGVSQAPVPPEAEDRVSAITSAIQSLRDTARELLERGSPGVRKRCALYALDQPYVQTLEAASNELATLARQASDAAAVARKKVQVERTFACAKPLVEQLVQAFEHASKLDRNIGQVRTPNSEAQGKRSLSDPKARSTQLLQKTEVMQRGPALPRVVEKLLIGNQTGVNQRFKR